MEFKVKSDNISPEDVTIESKCATWAKWTIGITTVLTAGVAGIITGFVALGKYCKALSERKVLVSILTNISTCFGKSWKDIQELATTGNYKNIKEVQDLIGKFNAYPANASKPKDFNAVKQQLEGLVAAHKHFEKQWEDIRIYAVDGTYSNIKEVEDLIGKFNDYPEGAARPRDFDDVKLQLEGLIKDHNTANREFPALIKVMDDLKLSQFMLRMSGVVYEKRTITGDNLSTAKKEMFSAITKICAENVSLKCYGTDATILFGQLWDLLCDSIETLDGRSQFIEETITFLEHLKYSTIDQAYIVDKLCSCCVTAIGGGTEGDENDTAKYFNDKQDRYDNFTRRITSIGEKSGEILSQNVKRNSTGQIIF